MSSNSLTNIAYDLLKTKEEPILFTDLWNEMSQLKKFPDKIKKRKAAAFYNALMLDPRFIPLEDNNWDLRERHDDIRLNIDSGLLEGYEDYDEDDDDYDEKYDEDEKVSE